MTPPAALALAALALPLPGVGVSLLAPWGAAAGAAVAAALVALHAISVGRPRAGWLPTARFVPERPPRAARRLARPTDRRLLAVRALAALLAGLALARPVPTAVRAPVVRLVLADRSRAADPAAAGGLENAGFKRVEISVVAREEQPPHFETLLAAAWK